MTCSILSAIIDSRLKAKYRRKSRWRSAANATLSAIGPVPRDTEERFFALSDGKSDLQVDRIETPPVMQIPSPLPSTLGEGEGKRNASTIVTLWRGRPTAMRRLLLRGDRAERRDKKLFRCARRGGRASDA